MLGFFIRFSNSGAPSVEPFNQFTPRNCTLIYVSAVIRTGRLEPGEKGATNDTRSEAATVVYGFESLDIGPEVEPWRNFAVCFSA